jgi:sterol desaturase/sphingolipid hydroxylase (fatty acid hydroxylase superfamily)
VNQIFEIFQEALEMPFSYFVNPQKRIYFLYIFTSVLLAYYVFKRLRIKTRFIAYVFPKKVWLSNSAFIDYYLIFINSFVKLICIAPFLIYGLYIAFYVNEYLLQQFGFPEIALNKTLTLVLYTFTLTILNDFFSFLIHYAMHKIGFLWEFHKIHHSATELTPITQYRIHPVELLINNIRGIVIFGLTTGFFDYLSDNTIHKIMFLGANVFSFWFLAFGANLRHTHIKLTYFNWLEYVFISPFQHQIHHSNDIKHYDKNMGSKLAIWDWMFGTLVRSKQVDNIHFGLGASEDKNYNTLSKNLFKPFTNYYFRLRNSLKRIAD